MAVKEEGVFIGNYQCVCGKSSDAMSVYEKVDDDGKPFRDGYCRSGFCERKSQYIKPKELGFELIQSTEEYSEVGEEDVMTDDVLERIESIQLNPWRGWKERRLPKNLSEFYEVHTELDDHGGISKRFYPVYDQEGKLACYHVRDQAVKDAKAAYKEAKGSGEDTSKFEWAQKRPPFYSIGKNRATHKLLGQTKFSGGGKFLVITEGCEDALAYYKALSNNEKGYETPVVSITSGSSAAAKQIKANYEWVTSFEKVFIAFDNDEAGEKATEEVARLLKPQQAYIINLRRNDPCEHVQNREERKLVDFFWKADKYSPVGVLKLSQMWDAFETETGRNMIPFPPAFGGLNEMMGGGMEPGEITLIGALTSIGKSTVIAHTVHHILKTTNLKIGAMYLEGTKREVVRDLLSIDQQTNYKKKKREELNMSHLRDAFFNGVAADDRFTFVDHQGSLSTDDLIDKFRYLAKVEGCNVIFVDPLQAALASDANSETINFMDAILKIAKETDCAIAVVSHMRKPADKNPHEVSEYDLLGSSSQNQIAFNTILLSRDKMNDDPKKRNSTLVQLAKCRRTGETGVAGWFRYDGDTTMIYATPDPYKEDDADYAEAERELFGDFNDDGDEEDNPVVHGEDGAFGY